MRFLRNILLTIICTLFVIPTSWAEIEFAGFMSVGGGQLIDDDEIDEYVGFDGKWKSDPDTVFALQISAPISDRLSATGQLVAKGTNDYNVEAEWAYLSYAVNDQWDIRAGRFRIPFFKYSDFIDVGYAYPYIRPPSEVYRILFTNLTGVDTLYNTSFGDWQASFQFYYGRLAASVEAPGETIEFDLANLMGINMSFSYDWLTLSLSHSYGPETTIPTPLAFTAPPPGAPAGTPALFDALAGFPTVVEALDFNNEMTSFTSVSINIDYNDWLLDAEYTELNHRDQAFLSSDEAWFFMVGRRWGDFTFHITYDIKEPNLRLGFLDVIPDGVNDQLDGLKALIAGQIVDQEENNTLTFGVRYELAAGAALKVEYAEIELQPFQAGPELKGSLLSFAVDIVF
ncbi:MAG: hypothetical protein KUG79_08320 [Pseudomonadales bacterium]|nr:hypothetical protein [Pseudomonadales bacterium]